MFFVDGVRFNDLQTTLRIYRQQAKSKEEVLSYFSEADNKQEVARVYDSLMPFTVQEAILLPNSEQRMVSLRGFEIEDIVAKLDAEKIDTQTITKKQIRWDKQLKPQEVVFEDTYELFKIGAKILGVDRWWGQEPAIYFVKCQCPSTDRNYFIYVPAKVAKENDAITAIAWTMRFNGVPLNKEQYLNLMYTES